MIAFDGNSQAYRNHLTYSFDYGSEDYSTLTPNRTHKLIMH